MFATFSSAPLPRARRTPVRTSIRSLARPPIAIAATLVALATLMALRFGLYATTHGDMPVIRQLLERIH